MLLIENKIYRRSELHKYFGGQKQGGISTPAKHPVMLLFTGEAGIAHGYSDGWVDGIYRYFGEGQRGDMPWVRGNAAIRDHISDGKDLLLFEIVKKPRTHVRYLGRFFAGSWEYERAPDREGKMRQAIVFHLSPADEIDESTAPPDASDLIELRKKAVAAGSAAPEKTTKVAKRSYVERSLAVRDYALARAAGLCERCEKPAPFQTASGIPFLEVHHIHRLTDGGPDLITSVAAVCPNCHRECHHGVDRLTLNVNLQRRVHEKERRYN